MSSSDLRAGADAIDGDAGLLEATAATLRSRARVWRACADRAELEERIVAAKLAVSRGDGPLARGFAEVGDATAVVSG